MDLERMKIGNMTAAFFAVCVDYNNIRRGTGRQRQDTLLHAVLDLCRKNPDKIGLAKTAADVRRLASEGKLAAILSVEGAQAIEERLDLLQELWDHGVRSIAPAHFTSNGWADSSADQPRHGGLSALGRQAIKEINRLGMIIDVSHISDQGFWQVLDASSCSGLRVAFLGTRAARSSPQPDRRHDQGDWTEGRHRRDHLVPGILLGGASARARGEGAFDRPEGAWI